MSWLEVFVLASMMNLGMTALVMIFHRLNKGVSPWWEASALVAVVLWMVTVVLRVATDVLAIPFASGALLVQTFFWGGLTCVAAMWAGGQLRWYYLHWGLDETPDPKTPAN